MKVRMPVAVVASVAASLFVRSHEAHAVQRLWGDEGILISAGAGNHVVEGITTDNNRGAVIVWVYTASGNYDIRAQRVDADGVTLWKQGGVSLYAGLSQVKNLEIISDGDGGAIVVWEDRRNNQNLGYDIYAQRVDGNGVAKWQAGGLAISSPLAAQWYEPRITTDGNGGAIIAWYGADTQFKTSVHAKRLDAAGNTKWSKVVFPYNPVLTWTYYYPEIVSNGSGGAILFSNATMGPGVSATHPLCVVEVDSNGAYPWPAKIILDTNKFGCFSRLRAVTDGAGGAIVAFPRCTLATKEEHPAAQRVDANGNVKWPPDGVVLHSQTGNYGAPPIVPDGAGGAIIACNPSAYDWTELLQRVDASGNLLWGPDGIEIQNTSKLSIAACAVGECIIASQGASCATGGITARSFVQRLDAGGVMLWGDEGVCPCLDSFYCPELISDGLGGAIVAFESMGGGELRAQRVGPGYIEDVLVDEKFETWPPPGWDIVMNGGDCQWTTTTVTGKPNYAGGAGAAATADSLWCGPGKTMDTELRTPPFDLSDAEEAYLDFVTAYLDNIFSPTDIAKVDISKDGGGTWKNLISVDYPVDPWGPGYDVRMDLTDYAGSSNAVVRFRYKGANDGYLMVDDVRVTAYVAPTPTPTPTVMPNPTATPPIDLTAQKNAFNSSDRIAVHADVWRIPVPCYPFVRVVMANKSTIYYVAGQGFMNSPAPYLGFETGPIRVGAPIHAYPCLDQKFGPIPLGTYYLEGGAVDMTKTTSASNLVYFGRVDRETLKVQQ